MFFTSCGIRIPLICTNFTSLRAVKLGCHLFNCTNFTVFHTVKLSCIREPKVIGHEVGKIKIKINFVFPLICANFAIKIVNVVKMHTREEKLEAFGRLLDVLDRLRKECPWDRKQTNESLRPNTIEEVFELCDALIKNDKKNICKELGDVIMHVIFYAKIGEEMGDFDIADICNKEADKLIFRHPHVYGEATANSAQEVLESWEQIKLKEKDGNKSVLSGVPDALPSLIKAYRIQEKARNVGFDWEDKEDVWAKVHEELDELEAELKRGDKEKSTHEMGDFLFSVINAARLYKLNPDNALEHTNQKFIRRFNYIEEHSIKAGKPLTEMTLEEMDKLWNEAKKEERGKRREERPTPNPPEGRE